MQYPVFKRKGTIGVTAPSSGVPKKLHSMFKESRKRMENRGYQVVVGETPWQHDKAKSASAAVRAAELQQMMENTQIDMVIPPWGGELAIELLDLIDFSRIQPKWLLGYSDISTLLLSVTLKTGIATAHGTNLVDVRGEKTDETTAMWENVLATKPNEAVTQYSSVNYQKDWQHDHPSPWVFHLTEATVWQTIPGNVVHLQGRFLGGCVDVIRHLIGTPYGNVSKFRDKYTNGEPIIWYLENAELSTTDLRRSLVQMKLAGWFENCSGLLFGRSSANESVDHYNVQDVYRDLANELRVPIVYQIDCGHVPPQMTFINGALGEVRVKHGKGRVKQFFR